ncbi:MAG TPA: type 4a pilus biogenesis protein PilO [Bdellovibrionales bacterium]|nr:type 4a pilus biogenesis protein PilO [Bdellovibrionales bacterium]
MDELVDRLKTIPPHFLVAGAFGLALLYYFLYFDSGEAITARINAKRAELASVQKDLSDTEAVIGDRQKFEQEYNRVSDQFRAAIEYLPSNFNIQSLLKQIYSEARSAGIELDRTAPQQNRGPAPDGQFYQELLIDVTLTGTYPQLTLFLSYISRLQRIVNIRDIELITVRVVDGTQFLSMKGTLVSYRYLEGK